MKPPASNTAPAPARYCKFSRTLLISYFRVGALRMARTYSFCQEADYGSREANKT